MWENIAWQGMVSEELTTDMATQILPQQFTFSLCKFQRKAIPRWDIDLSPEKQGKFRQARTGRPCRRIDTQTAEEDVVSLEER